MKIQTVGDLKKHLEQYSDNTKLISASDDEGNSYSYIYYTPTPGKFDGEEFWSDNNLKEAKEDDKDFKFKGKRVLCIN